MVFIDLDLGVAVAEWLVSLTCNLLPLSAVGLRRGSGRIYMSGSYPACLRMMGGCFIDVNLGIFPPIKAGMSPYDHGY